MKKNIIIVTAFLLNVMLLNTSCKKGIINTGIKSEENSSADNSNNPGNDPSPDNGATIGYIPLNLTIFSPCCQEQIYLEGTIHRVQNSNVIHMDDRDISGVGLTSGLNYTVQSTSVRNYVFDPSEYQATLNWSIRMTNENGCGYNVQFVVHVTRDDDGEIRASIHSGNFFCL